MTKRKFLLKRRPHIQEVVVTDLGTLITNLPLEQQAIKAKCFHPSGVFTEFKKEEIEQSIPDRFEKIAQMYPDRLAVKTKEHALTYGAVNEAANRLAQALLSKQGQEAEPIAVLLDQDTQVIIGILGVLKAGKICVALDPSHPRARIDYVLENTTARLVVTNSQNLSSAAELVHGKCHLMNIDEIDSNFCAENVGLSISPDAFAYLLYTSGSTGQPKGVIQNHRNLLHHIRVGYTNSLHICAEDRIALFASCSGGQGLKTAFCALLNGAALYIRNLKEEGITDLASWLITEKISIYISAATVFRSFVSTLSGAEEFPELRLIKLGSEPVRKTDVKLFKEHFSPECILVNWLTSTETGNFVHYFIDKKTEITGDLVPVGYAVEDVEFLLLDDAGRELGINHIGEIAVRSRYISPGYWQRPDLTQAKFLSGPAGEDRRIYLTGDLGRMLPDGCLEHLGRKDFRVKIRGFGVQLEEVEKTLRGHPTVREAIVEARMGESKDARLIAYIVPDQTQSLTTTELRRLLQSKLPDYMIPSAFVFLEALPLSPNGKVDRRSLPPPGRSRPELDTAFVAPRTPVEEELARIWVEVLSIDQVGVYDNFLELGGHSLAATQVISRAIKKFEFELPVQFLFQAPTVAQMAAAIGESRAKKLDAQDLDRILTDVESLSENEARQFLAQGKPKRN